MSSVPAWVLHLHPDTQSSDWEPFQQGWKHKGALVAEGATVGRGATVGEWVTVGDGATIADGAIWFDSPLCVIRALHVLCVPEPGYAKVGYTTLTYEEWEAKGDQIAAREGYGVEEVAAYKAFLALARVLHPAPAEVQP